MRERSYAELLERRQRIVETAQAVLDGQLGLLEGCHRLASLSYTVDPHMEDKELLSMVGIASQTDHLPIGAWRREWAPEALRAKDAEMAENEDYFRESALESCRALVERYSRPA